MSVAVVEFVFILKCLICEFSVSAPHKQPNLLDWYYELPLDYTAYPIVVNKPKVYHQRVSEFMSALRDFRTMKLPNYFIKLSLSRIVNY